MPLTGGGPSPGWRCSIGEDGARPGQEGEEEERGDKRTQ